MQLPFSLSGKLQDLSGVDDACSDADSPALTLKYGCIVQLTFPQHHAHCQGVGVAEETFQNLPGASIYLFVVQEKND